MSDLRAALLDALDKMDHYVGDYYNVREVEKLVSLLREAATKAEPMSQPIEPRGYHLATPATPRRRVR